MMWSSARKMRILQPCSLTGRSSPPAPPREFFGSNSFYTTASNRMSRCIFENAVTAQDVAALYRENLGEKA